MISSTLSRLLLFLVSLVFWRKKPKQGTTETGTADSSETGRTISEQEASRSREILKVLTLEREIVGTALTTIYESEAQGIITRDERDRLLEKYSSDLKELEARISEHQRIVEIFDLLSARKELDASYREKLVEMDKKLADLRSGAPPSASPTTVTAPKRPQPATPSESVEPTPERTFKPPPADLKETKMKTEKKIEAIREEVLKAMERLEQIESEG